MAARRAHRIVVQNNPVNFIDPSGHWPSWNDIKNYGQIAVGIGLTFLTPVCPACGIAGVAIATNGAVGAGAQVNVDPQGVSVNSERDIGGYGGPEVSTDTTITDVSGNDLSREGRRADIEDTVYMMPLDTGGLGYSTRPQFYMGGSNEHAFLPPMYWPLIPAAVDFAVGFLDTGSPPPASFPGYMGSFTRSWVYDKIEKPLKRKYYEAKKYSESYSKYPRKSNPHPGLYRYQYENYGVKY